MAEQKIILGDAYQLVKEIADKSVDLIITDPPYDIPNLHGSGIMKSRKKGKFTDELKEGSLDKGIDLSILNEFVRVMKKINIYIWCNKKQIFDYLVFFHKEKNCNYEIFTWCKENPIPFCGAHYLVDKEYCLYFWEQGATLHVPFNRGGTYFLSKTNIIDKEDFSHPTCKPVSILTNFVLNSSKEGDLILDCFSGSGSTAIACKNTNRNFIGFEINKKFYKSSIDRLEGITSSGQIKLFDI
ncbi:MAG: hypothetical protein J6S85_06525 [Methanobrevibacter sp.]|nr:hypothetical protein [Methanobrevibacter sp.]